MIKKLNPNLLKIVNALRDGNYHDGTSLGIHCGMTRSAVWKAIQKLIVYGIKIDSVKGRGYALQEPLQLLDRNKIRQALTTTDKVELHIYESVNSTNDLLMNTANKKNIKICLAETQLQGKGRLGRDWYSPFARNIYLSCLYPFQKDISQLAGLSLVVALAIVSSMRQLDLAQGFSVKWPNDVLFEHKKVAGNLIEVQAETHGVSNVIIGIGINVNMVYDDKQISQPWTSLRNIVGEHIDRNKLAAHLINHLLKFLQHFNEFGFATFMTEWGDADALINQSITVNHSHKKIEGKALGVDEQGRLIVRVKNGTIIHCSSGEASVSKQPRL